MRHTVQWLKRHLEVVSIFGDTHQDAVFYISTDSRKILLPKETAFLAIKSSQRNGHAFIGTAYNIGVRVFIVSEKPILEHYPDALFFLVENTLQALQQMAAAWRQAFIIPVVGITGSNGKTIVKEWLFQLLQNDFNIVRSPGSYNSQIGVPLSVWQMQDEHTLAFFEAGISETGEMAALAHIIQPTLGVFTDIGSAHDIGFSSKKEKIQEKIQLFATCQAVVYSMDDAEVETAMQAWQAAKPERHLRSISEKNTAATFFVQRKKLRKNGTTYIELLHLGEKKSFSIPFSDQASYSNALRCFALLTEFGVSLRVIRRRMLDLQQVKMRMETMAGIHQCTIINDSYNNDLTSLGIALEQANRQNYQSKFSLILSDLLQSTRENLYAEIARLLSQYQVGRLIGIGEKIQAIAPFLPTQIEQVFFPNTAAFLADFHTLSFRDELVLLKGARPFAFEQIAQRLELRSHKAQMEIDLSALVHNLNVYRRCIKPPTKLLVMVKASGYGSGSLQVAQVLQYHGVDYLGVAYADEGVFLREKGINLPILVLNTDASEFDLLSRYQLEPEVFSIEHLRDVQDYCKKNQKKLRIHLKFNTGMNRLGFQAEDLDVLRDCLLEAQKFVEVISVFSHLAGSDTNAFNAYTQQQASLFLTFFEKIKDCLPATVLRHLANTGGIVRHPQYHFEMVRLGIGLYGIESGATPEPLRVVNTVKATITQIRTVAAGESIGYNRGSTMQKESRIATVNIGYADGLLRLAGQGRYALFLHGALAPIVGNVCMDMCMLDVSHIPKARAGDSVEVFGKNVAVESLAKALQSIVYEVFTNISDRVKRVYIEE